ncbi:MAG TPA: glycosyltransferase family 1 protein [Candidatus Marinimicrobia bacterium]|nr:glycosyltransferase family 1 protein [Candidatus Neomarinimicrobiota bacterium]
MKSINIAFVYLAPAEITGGIQKIIHELSRRHLQSGFEAIVITRQDPQLVNERFFDFGGAKIYRLPTYKRIFGRNISKGFAHISCLFAIPTILKKENIDIVFLMDVASSRNPYYKYVAWVGRRMGLIVMSYIGSTPAELSTEKEKRAVAEYSDAIIAATEYNKNIFKDCSNKVQAIPLGYDGDVMYEELMNEKENVVLSVGGIRRRKNYYTLVEAAKEVVNRKEGVKFYIVGGIDDPDYLTELKKLVTKYKLENSVFFIGRVADEKLSELYRKAKLFYLPSEHEMFGIVFVEAMAHGLPIVASNVAAIPEVVGAAGMLFDPENYISHANAIINLLEDEELYFALHKESLERSKFFSWDRTYKHFMKSCNQVLKGE